MDEHEQQGVLAATFPDWADRAAALLRSLGLAQAFTGWLLVEGETILERPRWVRACADPDPRRCREQLLLHRHRAGCAWLALTTVGQHPAVAWMTWEEMLFSARKP